MLPSDLLYEFLFSPIAALGSRNMSEHRDGDTETLSISLRLFLLKGLRFFIVLSGLIVPMKLELFDDIEREKLSSVMTEISSAVEPYFGRELLLLPISGDSSFFTGSSMIDFCYCGDRAVRMLSLVC
jgi:hypothetical protein